MTAVFAALALFGQAKLDYAKDVFPILQKYCVGCHNADDLRGGLNIADFKEFQAGGKKGAAFIAGKSGESRMILMGTGKAKPSMPPKDSPKPTNAEWKNLAAWIDAGARGPSAASIESSEGYRIAKKHDKPTAVGAVAFSADGKTLAIARGVEVALIDPANGNTIRTLEKHTGRVTALRFSRKGDFLATASGVPGKFGEVRLFDLNTGKAIRTLARHKDALYGLDVSSDGKLIASAGYDREIVIWDSATGQRKHSLKGHNDAVYALAFSPDGTKLASASGDRTFKIWSVAKGERLDTFSAPLQDQYSVAFSVDGNKLFGVGADNRVRVWSISKTGVEGSNNLEQSKFAHESAILQIAMSLDGKTFATASQDRVVKIWRTDSVSEVGVLEKQPDWPAAIALSPDGSLLAVGRRDGSAELYSTANQKSVRKLENDPPAKPTVVALASVMPGGVERGATTKLLLVGDGIHQNGVGIKFNNPAMSATIESKTKTSDGKVALSIFVTTKEVAKKETVDLVVTTPAGASKPLKLAIDDIPQIAESEADAVQVVGNPVSVWGVVSKRGDMDAYSIEGRPGETLVFDLTAKPLGSKLDALLEVFDPDGRPVESSTSFDGDADPLVMVTPKKPGRYRVVVRDNLLGGSNEHRYRLSMGRLSFVTGVFPLGVSKAKTAQVTLVGANLGEPNTPKTVSVDASIVGDAFVTLPSDSFRFRRPQNVAVSDLPETVESEPNDDAKSATKMSAPGVADGRFNATKGADVDYFRFSSKKGERWIVETDAVRRGSPVDTKIEVLDANAKPIPKIRLQAVRDANIHFRNIDSIQAEIRTTNWTEMELNQYLYMGGEVGKYYRLPQGPDSGFLFYTRKNARLAYFDTSPTAHALGDPIYIVEPHREGQATTTNGLPIFTLNYENDDASDRTIGRDSRLTFVAPVDGEYLLRVTDSRAKSGDRFAYRAIVRRPKPDFNVSIAAKTVTVGAGSGQEIEVFLDRTDGFDDEVTLTVDPLPKGFHLTSPVTVQAGHNTASLVLFADGDAKMPAKDAPPIKITASATIDGKNVMKPAGKIEKINLAPRPKLLVHLEPKELTIRPGETVTAELTIERHGYNDRVTFDFPNLPHGVFIDNIGLSGILIRPKETKRQVFITARPWVPETSRPFSAQSKEEGKHCSPPLMLHVRKSRAVAEK